MSISFLSVFSNVSVCSAHLIILFHPSSDLLTITTSRDRSFSPLVDNQTVVHLWRWSILCNFTLIAIYLYTLPDARVCHLIFNKRVLWFAVSGSRFSRCEGNMASPNN